MNPARVIPAAKGCYPASLRSGATNKLTNNYFWDTDFILISDMNVLHSDLNIVDDFGDERLDEALGLC